VILLIQAVRGREGTSNDQRKANKVIMIKVYLTNKKKEKEKNR